MTRRPCLTLLTAAILSTQATFSVAGTISDKAAEIEAALSNGDQVAAWSGVGSLSDEAWNAATQIGFSAVSLTTERSVDYGVYNPRADNKFTAESPVIIYTEPWGYGYGSAGEGLYSINFAVDLEVLNSAGETLGSLKDIAKIDFISRNRRKETNATVIFNLGGISPGVYVLKVTFRDLNSDKSGTFDLPIEIVQ